MSEWLIITLALAATAMLAAVLLVPNPLRDGLRRLVRIKVRTAREASTTPLERELALVAGPQKVIDDALQQVQDLRGNLLHERNVLLQRRDVLHATEEAYYKACDEKADGGTINEQVALVADNEQEMSIQQSIVDGLESACSTACAAVDTARKELRKLQMTVKSDEAKAKATAALGNAAKVIEAAQSVSANGGALAEASRSVHAEFEQARARLDLAQGTPLERELRSVKEQEELSAVRKRLDARRAAQSQAKG